MTNPEVQPTDGLAEGPHKYKPNPGTPAFEAWQAEFRAGREKAIQEYREAMRADCPHGPRKKVIRQSGGKWYAGLACPMDKPNCGINYLSIEQVMQEWRDRA